MVSIWFYLTTYELSVQGMITKNLLYKAIGDGNFPDWYGKIYVDYLFEQENDQIAFMEFMGSYITFRHFAKHCQGTRFINLEDFKNIV